MNWFVLHEHLSRWSCSRPNYDGKFFMFLFHSGPSTCAGKAVNTPGLVCLQSNVLKFNHEDSRSSPELVHSVFHRRGFTECSSKTSQQYCTRTSIVYYCGSLPPPVLLGVQVYTGLLADLCGWAGTSFWSADSWSGGRRARRELCMMWASNISSNRSYKGTMFFIFM